MTGAGMYVSEHRLVGALDDARVPLIPTPNVAGTLRPRFVVMHYTAGPSLGSAVRALTDPARKVSSHLVIGRDGEIVQLAPFDRVTWHAGRSQLTVAGETWTGFNRFAVGIELVNAGWLRPAGGAFESWWGESYPAGQVVEAPHPNGGPHRHWQRYPDIQLVRAAAAVAALERAYDIVGVVGHEEIAPERKTDPGPAFPWDLFR